jgi:tetratricopeptide (TPR) repeat protein
MREYSTALSYYEKTLEIQQKSLPVNQQSLGITYYNTAKVLEDLQQYEKATEHAKQAVAFAC